MVELKRRFEGFIAEAKKLIPVETSSFRQFAHAVEDRGVSLVTAEVYSEFGFGKVQEYFDLYIHQGKDHATIYEGVGSDGRKIRFEEHYDVERPSNQDPIKRGRVILRSLVTAEARLRQLKESTPFFVKTVIAGHSGREKLPDMGEEAMYALREVALNHRLDPYPEKIDRTTEEELRRIANKPF